MKIWLIAPWCSAEDLVVLGKHAETLGFEGIMGADHGFVPQSMAAGYLYSDDGKPPISGDMPYPDVWTSLTAVAAATTTLKLSTAVYVLPLRHPIEVAKAAGTLARLSDDRLVLGVGAGWMQEEFDVYGVDFKRRGKRMNEMIEVMRKLWAGGFVSHEGEFFRFAPLQIAPVPRQPVSFYMGGASDLALKRAARLGQGWIGAGNSIAEVPAILSKLDNLRAEAGREDGDFETVIPVHELQQVEEIKRLEALGMTSTVFGFPDYTVPLADKLKQMDAFARYLMPQLQ